MRYIYKSNITDALESLASYEDQRLTWFDNDQGLSYSFYENIMDLFYDSGLDEALKAREIIFGSLADNALRELESLVDKVHKENYTNGSFIDEPQMQTIRERAARALFLINVSTGEGSTVGMLEPGMVPPA